MDGIRGASPAKNSSSADSPEQLINSFKEAALSVTKLYKTSAAAQTKARADGYQDCLDDLLTFLDRKNLGLKDGEGWQIRSWATERLGGREYVSQAVDSDEENERNEPASSPPMQRPDNTSSVSNTSDRTESTPPQSTDIVLAPEPAVVPSQENFTFQSSHPYPQDQPSYPNLATLALSDSNNRTKDSSTPQGSSSISATSQSRSKLGKRVPRPKTTTTTGAANLGKGAGQKRSINFAELFDVGNFNFGKDLFGRDGKRPRHT